MFEYQISSQLKSVVIFSFPKEHLRLKIKYERKLLISAPETQWSKNFRDACGEVKIH
jgi:hypothetical protein